MEEIRLFAILDKNNVVINVIAPPKYVLDPEYGDMVIHDPSYLLPQYPEAESLQEYSQDDDSITKNPAAIGYTYDPSLNAFIPPAPDETYLLNTELFEWYPNPELEYTIEGKLCKWIPNFGWRPIRK